MITIQYLKVIIIIRKNHIHFRIHLTLNPNDTNTFKIIYIKVLKIIYIKVFFNNKYILLFYIEYEKKIFFIHKRLINKFKNYVIT
jgi:hypothetical protein